MQLDHAWFSAAETLPVVVYTALPDGRIEFVTNRWYAMTGLNASTVLDDAWMQIVHPEDLEATAAAWSHSLAAGTPLCVDLRIRRPDGSYKWVRSQAEPVRDERGVIERWMGVVLDIDEPHEIQQRLSALSESIPVLVWTANSDGWIDWYNARWYEYTGQTPEEARGWGWQAVHHPDDLAEVMRKWPESLATGTPFEMEFRLRGADGIYRWFLTRVTPVANERGKIERWYGSNVDVDAQKRALERSKRVAETLQDVFLPGVLPIEANFFADAAYVAAEKDALVGGDWYDAFALPGGEIVFSIGDVAGHGLEASVLVGRLRQVIYTLAFQGIRPSEILSCAGAILQYQNPETFVTALVGVIDVTRESIVYANAGQPPLMFASPQGARFIEIESAPPLGVREDTAYADNTLRVKAGETVVAYTDGMLEFSRDIESGERRMLAAGKMVAADASLAHPAKAIQDTVLAGVAPSDDAAVLVLRFGFAHSQVVHSAGQVEKTWRFHSSHAFSAHAARREIIEYVRRFSAPDEDLFSTELVVGEVLANTVEHAPGLVEVCLDWSADEPLLSVRDSGEGMTNVNCALPSDPLEENGRGLFLAKTLARDFIVQRSADGGTEVRMTLPVRKQVRLGGRSS